MRLPSSEALTISAVLNTGDLSAALGRGIGPEHFNGYRPEFEFLTDYVRRYHDLPSADILTGQFPDFPYKEAANQVAFYADQTIERANARMVKAAMMASAEKLANGNTEAALALMREVRLTTGTAAPTDAVRSYAVADLLDSENDTGVPYPWKTPQRISGGMRPGDFVVYGGRTGHGKSWALVYTACCAAQLGLNVRYLSLEMPAAQLIERIHVVLAEPLGYRISHTALHQRTVDRIAYKKLLADLQATISGTIEVIDTVHGRITPMTIASCLGADLVVVDHLGLMSTGDGRRAIEDWRVMAAISNQCKEQAIGINTPVLAAAQVNREGGKTIRMPTTAEIAQSDAIGQDADFIVMSRRMGVGKSMRHHVTKNRHGMSEVPFFTLFDPDYGRLHEIEREIAEEIRDEAEP